MAVSDDARGELVPNNYSLKAAIEGELQQMADAAHLQRTKQQEYCAVEEPFAKGGPLSQLWAAESQQAVTPVDPAENCQQGGTPDERQWREQAERRQREAQRSINGTARPG